MRTEDFEEQFEGLGNGAALLDVLHAHLRETSPVDFAPVANHDILKRKRKK
jgi:hypothetical protein